MHPAIAVIAVVLVGAAVWFLTKRTAPPPYVPPYEPPYVPPDDDFPTPPPDNDWPAPPSLPALYGHVENRDTGARVAGAAIRLSGPKVYTTTTDSQGAYSIINIEPGLYHCTVTADGYQTDASHHQYRADTDFKRVVRLVPVGISVKVLNPTGGQTWRIGETYNLQWQAYGLDQVEVTFRYHLPAQTISRGITGGWDKLPASPGQYSWTIPHEWGPGRHPVEPGEYTIRVNGFKDGKYITFDESKRFKITH